MWLKTILIVVYMHHYCFFMQYQVFKCPAFLSGDGLSKKPSVQADEFQQGQGTGNTCTVNSRGRKKKFKHMATISETELKWAKYLR